MQTIPSDITRFIRNLFAGLRRNFLHCNINKITEMSSINAKDESIIKLIGQFLLVLKDFALYSFRLSLMSMLVISFTCSNL